MDIKRLEIKKNIQKTEDRNLSFRVFNLDIEHLKSYLHSHKKDHFCIIIVEGGKIDIHIEDKIYLLKSGKISIIFLTKSIFFQILVMTYREKSYCLRRYCFAPIF